MPEGDDEEGLERELLQHVWHRLQDRALLDREDLRDSISQLQRGDVIILRQSGGTKDYE